MRDPVTYYSSCNVSNYQYGVGFVVTKEINKTILDLIPFSEITMSIKIIDDDNIEIQLNLLI